MTDFWKSVDEWLKEKTNSPLYFTFFVFYIAWNWKFFYFLFLEDSSLLIEPRINYIQNLGFHFLPQKDFPDFLNSLIINLPTSIHFFQWGTNFLFHIGPPAFFTYLAIKYFPKIYKWAHRIYLTGLTERRLAYAESELEYNKKLKLIRENVVQVKEEIEEANKKLSEKDIWEIDVFHDLKNQQLSTALLAAENIFYSQSGRYSTVPTNPSSGWGYIKTEDLSLLDGFGLIEVDNNQNHLSLTDKGKFYLLKIKNRTSWKSAQNMLS